MNFLPSTFFLSENSLTPFGLVSYFLLYIRTCLGRVQLTSYLEPAQVLKCTADAFYSPTRLFNDMCSQLI